MSTGWQTDPELGEPHLVYLDSAGEEVGYVEQEQERRPPLTGDYVATGRWEWSTQGTKGVARSQAQAKAQVENRLGVER